MRLDAYIQHNQPAPGFLLVRIPVFARRSARLWLSGLAVSVPDFRSFPITQGLTSGS
jgi:hypothetical protein